MLTKIEIDKLINKIQLTTEVKRLIEMILRNFENDDEVTEEKLTAVIRLIIK